MNVEYKKYSSDRMTGRRLDGKMYKLRQNFTMECKDSILKNLVITGSIIGDNDYILDEEMRTLAEMLSEIDRWPKALKMLKDLYGLRYDSTVERVTFYEASNGVNVKLARRQDLDWVWRYSK